MIGQLQNNFRKFIASLCLVFATSLTCWAQTSLKDFTVVYDKPYQIEDIYSIRYNNLEQPSKLNAFKIEFYAPDNSKLGETTEAFPADSTQKTFSLSKSIVGFNSIKVTVISLHEGVISNFPSSPSSILALTLDNVITKPPEPPSNKPPTAQNYSSEIDASTDTTNLNISSYYSDSDGDVVTVIPKSLNGEEFSYSIESSGNLIITASSITGTYTIPYEIKDSKGAKASAEITINVNIPDTLKAEIEKRAQDITQIISDLEGKKDQTVDLGPITDETIQTLEDLLTKNKALAETITKPKFSDIKSDIDALTHEFEEKQDVLPDLILEEIETIESQSLALKTQLQALKDMSAQAGVDITDFTSDLNTLNNDITTLKAQEDTILEAKLVTLSQLEAWETAHQTLKDKLNPPIFPWPAIAIALIGLSLFLAALHLFRKRAPKRPHKQKKEEKDNRVAFSFPVHILKPEGDSFAALRKQYPQDMENYDSDKGELIIDPPMGLVFENSKMVPAQGGIPTASALIDKAYHAVGRVGYAQEGPAIGDDESMGTAILIDNNRVMTNRHVFDRHHHRIMDKGDPVGIEFCGEKDSDASDFYELTLDDVVIIEDYDAVILTLAKPVPETNRKPIKFAAKPPITFDESDVLVIGYPAEPSLMTDEIEEAMGGDDVFSVKRYSEGRMFRHPQDSNPEYGIETHTSGQYSKKKSLLAICHKASTLPGNSGSVVLSKETGELVALHFGADRFNRHKTLEPHPANVAHAGMFLANSVTFITSGAFENYLEAKHA